MRSAVLVTCLLAGTFNLYPEASGSSASRTTELSTIPSATSQAPMLNEAQIAGWVKRWQKRLSLDDWRIDVKIVRRWQLPKGTVANIHWSFPRKQATIKVLDSIDSTLPKSDIVRDSELSVVHELSHLSMAKLPLDSNITELEEEAVKKISAALLALDKSEEK